MGVLHDEGALRHAVEEIIETIAGLEAGSKRLGEILVEEGKVTEQDVKETLARQKPIGEMLIDEGKVTEADVEEALRTQGVMEAANQPRSEAVESETKTIRVDERRIDQLTNMAGELLVARNTYDYLLGELGAIASVPQATIRSLKDNLYLFSRVTNEMQQGVMSLRMVPIRGVFQKFQRVVRDISRKQQKMIELVTEGEDTEIDKKVADMLSDPLDPYHQKLMRSWSGNPGRTQGRRESGAGHDPSQGMAGGKRPLHPNRGRRKGHKQTKSLREGEKSRYGRDVARR